MIKNTTTIIALVISFIILAISEKSYRNIVLIIITILFLALCHAIDSYWLVKIILLIDYVIYFLDDSYYLEDKEEIIVDQKNYLRFNNKKKKEGTSNNITAIYLTVHLVILLVAIMVG